MWRIDEGRPIDARRRIPARRTLMHFGVRFVLVSALTLTWACGPAMAQDWIHYGGDVGGSRFSALDEINRDNVQELELAWTHRTGAVAENPELKPFIDSRQHQFCCRRKPAAT